MRQKVIENLKAKARELEARCNVIRRHLQDFPSDEFKRNFYHYDIEVLRLKRLNNLIEKI